MIKLVFVCPTAQGGGAERMQLNIMNSLSKEKYDITFITTGYDVRPLDLAPHIKFLQYKKQHARQGFGRLVNDLKDVRPSYVFTTSIGIAYLLQLGRWLAKLQFKLIVRIAVPPSEIIHHSLKSRVLKKVNNLTLRGSDLIIAQTEFSKNDIIKNYNVPSHKIKVIRNIVDKQMLEAKGGEFNPVELDEENYNIVAAGALYSVKGFDLLIEAIRIVADGNKKIKLFILGTERNEDGYGSKLLKLISERELQDIVFLLGHKDNPYPFLKSANLFVLSSRTEGFPNVVLEALYFGTPVVATNCVDFSDVIFDGTNGFVVEKESHLAIAEGIERAINCLKKSDNFVLKNYDYENLFL